MVWKKSKSKSSSKKSEKRRLKSVPEEAQQPPRLKSCLKKANDTALSDRQESASEDGSQRHSADASSTRDQSSTRSVATRSLASTNGSQSVESKGSASAGSIIRRRAQSGEQVSCGTSESSADNSLSPQNSERSKKVKFGRIVIREYARTVGDNPSCSSGAPISIGWKYGKTSVIDVDSFEGARRYRTDGLVLLSREAREALLLNWGASFHEIVDSVRANIKVKNQRRQTVTNLGRTERIEEAFESATRKLKRALMLRRRTGEKVKRLQDQANLAQSALASLKIAEDRALNEIRHGRIPTREEPEKDLESYELDVAVSNFGRSAPVDSKIRRPSHGALRLIVSEEEDYYSSIGGFTMGGSTTPSIMEMEKFYQELELEMFGDEELPSMVGQTLEVPKIRPSGHDSVEGLSGFNMDDSLNSGVPPSTLDLVGRFRDGMAVSIVSGLEPSSKSESKDENSSHAIDAALEEEQNRSMISQSLLEDDDSEIAKLGPSLEQGSQDALYRHFPLERMYPVHGDYSNSRYHSATSRLSSSLDSADPERARVTESVVALEYQFVQPHQPLVPLHTGMSMFHDCALLGDHNNESYPSRSNGSRRSSRSSRSDSNEGPKVQHLPPPTHLSPSHWMEEEDSPPVNFGQDYQTITINEDSVGQHNSEAYYYDDRYNHGRPTYVAAQQFPASFY